MELGVALPNKGWDLSSRPAMRFSKLHCGRSRNDKASHHVKELMWETDKRAGIREQQKVKVMEVGMCWDARRLNIIRETNLHKQYFIIAPVSFSASIYRITFEVWLHCVFDQVQLWCGL
ncbi:hypothetical protein XENOCAPTIV_010968 [Xenoophorus captivus]|uniref:Uncharacterized protein n=1 Tax=Xenoophorus captivus TaxID=1517983 RepID=A0ABV0QWG5_9TELE